MRKFIERALGKLQKLDEEQISALIYQIAKENEQLEMVLDSMTDGVIVLDQSHRITLCNKAAERLLPLTTADVEERAVWSVIGDREVAEFLHRSLVNEDKVKDKEYSVEAGGGVRVLTFSIMPLVQEGEIQGQLLHVEDITERRGKEARLRRAESLASLTTLAAGVAHEIKNPLGSIGIHIQLIQKSLKTPGRTDKKTVGHYLDIVNEEVDRLNRIVVDFLFAVRPMDARLQEGNPNQVIADLLEFVHFELEEGKVAVDSHLSENLPAVEFDEKLLKQALLNVINNAVAAMPYGGRLTVSTERRGEVVLIRIIDTGTGISDENMAKIFEPYFTTKEFGSGLGLTVVYKIVKEHGGEISLKSKEGEGTTFTISLPIPQKELRLLGLQREEA
ncbi:MAG TPA: ATP-binding protein [Spirochaetia bacterium]|nr:ATP-binding protein [Spirochaetia bacterium]